MSKTKIWCGYLNAGEKSAAVLRDDELDTGNPNTLYLFNLARNEILENSRAIVEPKLRELKGQEQGQEVELKAAFKKVRADFKPRGKATTVLVRGKATPAAKQDVVKDDVDDVIDDGDVPVLDELDPDE